MNDRVFAVDLQSGYNDLLHVGLSQYDVGVVLEFDVFDGGAAAVFPSGTTAKIQGVRPSGVGFDISCTLNGNVVTVSTVTDMTGEAGSFPVEIRFTASGVDVGTVNFVFQIEKAAHPDGTIDADITHEQDIVDKINQILIQTTPDTTLSEAGVAADSKTVGDNINRIDRQIGNLGTRITNVEDDISYQSQRVDRTNKIKAPVIWEEASGHPAIFDDGADGMYIKDLTLTLTPSQDLHGYDYAWAGGNGKNLLEAKTGTVANLEGGGAVTINSDGSITINGVQNITSIPIGNLATGFIGTGVGQNDGVKHIPNGSYILTTGLTNPAGIAIQLYGTNQASGVNDLHPITAASTGSIFTIDDTYAYNYMRLAINAGTYNNITIYPMIRRADITDATFAPYSNICPINGVESVTVKRTGKNLLGGLITTTTTRYGVTFTANSDGTYTANGTNNISGSSYYNYQLSGTGEYRLNLPTGDYYLNGGVNGLNGSGNTLFLEISDGTNDRYIGTNSPNSDKLFTINEGEYIRTVFICIANGATANNAIFRPMIRPASISDDTYEPYSGIDTNVDFGQTIYGGTVNPILWNLQGGDIVFDRKVFSVGDLTWSKQSGNIFKATPDNVTGAANYDMSDTFRRNPVADSAMENGDYKLTVAGTLYVKMEGYGTAAGFKAAYADAKFCAKLAHSEIGAMYPTDRREITTGYLDNVITALPDKGNVTNIKVTYPADTKAYIDKAIAAISG